MPRPAHNYTKEQREELLEAIFQAMEDDGMSLIRACRMVGPHTATYFRWIDEDENLSRRYAQARRLRALRHQDRVEELNEYAPAMILNKCGGEQIDPAWVAWRADQKKTEQWQAKIEDPAIFGDRVGLQHSGGITRDGDNEEDLSLLTDAELETLLQLKEKAKKAR